MTVFSTGSGSASGQGGFLPAGVGAYLRRRLHDAWGGLLLAAAFFLAGALATYNPDDPSLNSSVVDGARNMLGISGAYVADLFVQVFGLVSAVPVLVLGVWGIQIFRRRSLKSPIIRLTLLAFSLVLLSVSLSSVPHFRGWPLATQMGGVSGTVLLERSVALLNTVMAQSNNGLRAEGWMISIATLIPGLIALISVLGLTGADWKMIGKGLLTASRRTLAWVRYSIRGALDDDRNSQAAGTDRKPKRKALARRKSGVAGTAAAKARQVSPLITAKEPKPKAGRKATAKRQARLNFTPGEEFELPPHELLEAPPAGLGLAQVNKGSLEQNAKLLESVLDDFGVRGEIRKVCPGPVVTLYELEPAPGTKTSRVIGLSDDIARSMSAVSVRVAVVPGRNVIGIELPNYEREMVYLRELLASDPFERAPGKLNLALGKDIGGLPVTVDLARMPHLLIAGTTGSGKSVGINTMILSLLYQMSPEECKLIMIDPKMLELSVYEGIPHLLTPVVTEPAKAIMALKWAVREMEERYRAMSQLGVRNVAGYNARIAEAVKKGETLMRRVQTGFDDDGRPIMEELPLSMEPLPFIVIVVDEMADLMLVAGKDIEAAVQRLAQMARAAGIHIIMATQRPSVDVITGTIKANFPTRISFQVTSKIDSRTILGEQGAEQLLGQGDMLYMAGGGRVTRVHGPFVSDEEVENVVAFLKSHGKPRYLDEITEDHDDNPLLPGGSGKPSGDELYDEAVALIAREGKASTSFIQRHLQIGYNRAARIIEQMEKEGVVSKANRVGRREVLVGTGGDYAA